MKLVYLHDAVDACLSVDLETIEISENDKVLIRYKKEEKDGYCGNKKNEHFGAVTGYGSTLG